MIYLLIYLFCAKINHNNIIYKIKNVSLGFGRQQFRSGHELRQCPDTRDEDRTRKRCQCLWKAAEWTIAAQSYPAGADRIHLGRVPRLGARQVLHNHTRRLWRQHEAEGRQARRQVRMDPHEHPGPGLGVPRKPRPLIPGLLPVPIFLPDPREPPNLLPKNFRFNQPSRQPRDPSLPTNSPHSDPRPTQTSKIQIRLQNLPTSI